jgi:hypothetical protein
MTSMSIQAQITLEEYMYLDALELLVRLHKRERRMEGFLT